MKPRIAIPAAAAYLATIVAANWAIHRWGIAGMLNSTGGDDGR